jgi:hypothetical protein
MYEYNGDKASFSMNATPYENERDYCAGTMYLPQAMFPVVTVDQRNPALAFHPQTWLLSTLHLLWC